MGKKLQVEELLKNVFGPITFYDLKHFFWEIHNSNVDFIIFTTRRSHLLYCMFKKYFFYNTKPKCKNIIDDKALHFYSNSLYGKTCILADDIMIHGRSLNSIKKRLETKNPAKIDVYVYAVGENPIYSFDNFHAVQTNLSRCEWEILSNSIVASLQLTSTSYASYIFSFSKVISYKSFKKLIEKISKHYECKDLDLSMEEVDNESKLGNILSSNLECYIFNFPQYSNARNVLFSCIRVYYNKLFKTCTITPFVVIDQMDATEVRSMCGSVFPRHSKIVNTNCIEAKYRAITTYYSLDLIKNSLGLYRFFNWKINIADICMSYYKEFFITLFFSLSKSKIYKIKDSKYIFNTDKYRFDGLKEDIYFTTFEKLIKSPNKLNVFFDTSKITTLSLYFYKYLSSVNFFEEKLFTKGKTNNNEKQKGLSFSALVNKFENNQIEIQKQTFSKFEFFREIIQCADTGFLTIFVDYYLFDDKKIYSNFFVTGEQVCRLYQNKYVFLIYKLKKYYESCQQNDLVDFKEIINYCATIDSELTNNILDAYNYIIHNLEYSEFIFDSLYKTQIDSDLNRIYIMAIGFLKQNGERREKEQ